MKNINILLLGLIFILCSCGDNVIEEPDDSIFGYEYFPIDIGHTWEYQVDSVLIIQGGGSNIVSRSYIREEATELISDDDGTRTYKLERSFRKDLDSPWILQSIWQTSVDETKVTRTEENLTFIKLVFPAVLGIKWDGNVFFDSEKEYLIASNGITIYQGWDYKINAVGLTKTYNEQEYPNVIQVAHVDEESLISKRFSEEFYAEGIGLVERNMEIFGSQNGNTSLTWLERAEKGFQLNQKLISFSKN